MHCLTISFGILFFSWFRWLHKYFIKIPNINYHIEWKNWKWWKLNESQERIKESLKTKKKLAVHQNWMVNSADGWVELKGKVAMLTERKSTFSLIWWHYSVHSVHIFLAIKHTFHWFQSYTVTTFTNNFHSENCNGVLLLHVFKLLMSMSHCNNWRNLWVRRQSINMSSNRSLPIHKLPLILDKIDTTRSIMYFYRKTDTQKKYSIFFTRS